MWDRALQLAEIERWLREDDPEQLELLWKAADSVRQAAVGDEVHLRGLIEVSNCCSRPCGYCGIRSPNRSVDRYRMPADSVLEAARMAAEFGYGTVVMQAGEDPGIKRDWMAGVIRTIKRELGLAVTLSLGQRERADYDAWREAGADRYLLRFETSDPVLYNAIRMTPEADPDERFEHLRTLREIGYEIGTGVMLGIPGQSYTTLAHDIALLRELDVDMIGLGPYIPHPETPLALGEVEVPRLPPDQQAPATEEMAYKAVALARLVQPEAHIPSTTAIATLNREGGHALGLTRGANVIMPNLTPAPFRQKYLIYPGKAFADATGVEVNRAVHARIEALGRRVGQGAGGRRRM